MRAVIDFDDTIFLHGEKNNEIKDGRPIEDTVSKLRKLQNDGWEIIIFSSRGQNSCGGDLEKIKKKYQKEIEDWLKRYNVPYDDLIFGKPLGDIYVDDKGIGLEDFCKSDFGKQEGNSGEPVYRAGKRILKQCREARKMADWYAKAEEIGLNVPRVNSVVLDKIDIEYINGEGGEKRSLSGGDLKKIISNIMLMSLHKAGAEFDFDAYEQFIISRLKIVGAENDFRELFHCLEKERETIQDSRSFCHGDLSLSNTIFSDGKVYLIDPSGRREFSSFMNDFAKLRFSLDGGEELLHGMSKNQEWDQRLSELSDILSERGWLRTVKAMETVHWIRMLKYFPGYEQKIIRKAKALEAEL